MRYYRCKCGRQAAWSSMGVAACDVCPECGTTLAEGSDGHVDPAPHKYVTQYDQNTGVPYEVCTGCLRKRDEIEAKHE